MHQSIKSMLGSSLGDVCKVFNATRSTTLLQREKHQIALAKQKVNIITNFSGRLLYSQLIRKISYKAIGLINQQERIFIARRQKIEESNETLVYSPCTHTFTTTIGLPCVHEIEIHMTSEPKTPIEMHEIDRHWWLQDDISAVVENNSVLDPKVQRCRGRPKGRRYLPLDVPATAAGVATFDRSTRREPSAHEPRKLYELEAGSSLNSTSLLVRAPSSTAPAAIERSRLTSRKRGRVDTTANTTKFIVKTTATFGSTNKRGRQS
jgi:hypothetical protein